MLGFYFNTQTQKLSYNLLGSILEQPIPIKVGNELPIRVIFSKNLSPRALTAPVTITLGVKTAVSEEEFVAVCETWTYDAASKSYNGVLDLNTVELIAAIGTDDEINCVVDVRYSDANVGPVSSDTVNFVVERGVVTGDEGTPTHLPTPDEWLSQRAVRFDEAQTLTSGEKAQAQSNMGLGNSATRNVGTTAGTVAAGDDSRFSDVPAASLAATIHAATSKTTPVDADELPLSDSAALWGLKKLTWANIKATAKSYFDTVYAAIVHTHVSADITDASDEGSSATSGKVVLFNTAGGLSTTGSGASITTIGDYGLLATSGTYASISTSGAEATIGTNGENASLYTTGEAASFYTTGTNATVYTTGENAIISTFGASAHITTAGGAYIQTSSTFKITDGSFTTTLSGTQTADRAIALPDEDGTLALTSDITNAVTSATTSDGTANLSVATITGDGSGLTGLVSAQITDATKQPTPDTLVLRGTNGEAIFGDIDTGFFGEGLYSASGSGVGVLGASDSGTGAVGTSDSGIGVRASTESGLALELYSGGGDILKASNAGTPDVLVIDTTGGITSLGDIVGQNLSGTNTGDQTTITGNAGTATALQTARNIFGISFNGSADVNGNLLTSGHLASVPSGGGAGHLVTLNGTAPTVTAGRSAWWSDGSGVPSFRNGTGTAVTLVRSSDLGTNVATFLATPTSANLAAACTDETGSGSLVFATSPTLTTPVIGAATGTTLSLGVALPAATILNAYSSGSSAGNVWRGRMTVGGDTARFLMGEINGQAWLGAHNAALNAWEDFYINPDGAKKVGIGDLGGGSGNVAVPILTVDNATANATISATTASTSSTTGALIVAGGVGIGGRLVLNNVVRLKGYTFATLPAGTQGDKAFITDGAASPTFRANAAGGGSTVTEVFFNGTNWINS